MQVGVQVARGRADGAGALVQLARAVLVAVEQRAMLAQEAVLGHGGDAVGRVQARVLQSAAERAVGGQPRHPLLAQQARAQGRVQRVQPGGRDRRAGVEVEVQQVEVGIVGMELLQRRIRGA